MKPGAKGRVVEADFPFAYEDADGQKLTVSTAGNTVALRLVRRFATEDTIFVEAFHVDQLCAALEACRVLANDVEAREREALRVLTQNVANVLDAATATGPQTLAASARAVAEAIKAGLLKP